MVEHALFQADNDELALLELLLNQTADRMRVAEIERRVYFIQNIDR